MPTPAQNKATAKYRKENYDEYLIRLDKGKKALLRDYASERGETLNSFINRAIAEQIERDNANKKPPLE